MTTEDSTFDQWFTMLKEIMTNLFSFLAKVQVRIEIFEIFNLIELSKWILKIMCDVVKDLIDISFGKLISDAQIQSSK